MSNLLDLSFQKQDTCSRRIHGEYSEIEEDSRKRVKTSQNISVSNIEMEHVTPKIGAKQVESSLEESDFLDDIILNMNDDLSHISENNNISDKWQDESSIDSLLDSSSRRGEEERREQEFLRYQEEELTGYIGLISNEEKQRIVCMITQLIEITRSMKGRIISYKPLTIQCHAGHKWTTEKDSLLRKEWCQQCESQIFNIKIPKQNQEIPSFNLSENIVNQTPQSNDTKRKCKCSRNRSSLCKDCKLQDKLQRQRVQMESKKKLFEKYEEQQKSLYESAKKQFKRGDKVHKIVEAFKEMEQEIEKSALIHAQKYIEKYQQQSIDSDSEKTIIRKHSNDSTLNSSSEDLNINSCSRSSPLLPYLLALYKILLIPDEALAMYIKAQQKSILIQEYRLYARLVHPDKNRHPKAPVAFMKLRKYWVDLERGDKIMQLH